MVLGHVPVAGDGNCLFHALGYLDARDGAALRNEVAAFMVDQACNQHGFEEAWLEEADELAQGTWGGHTAITAYSLMKNLRVEVHTVQPSGAVAVTDASHANVIADNGAPLRRVLYSNRSHYDALVELLPSPRGWVPAWEQEPPIIYFKEEERNPPPNPDEFPPLSNTPPSRNRKGPRLGKPKMARKGAGKGSDAKPKNSPVAETEFPILRRCVTKTTPPIQLQEDILTEFCKIPVKPRMPHPHRQQEKLIKDRFLHMP